MLEPRPSPHSSGCPRKVFESQTLMNEMARYPQKYRLKTIVSGILSRHNLAVFKYSSSFRRPPSA